MGRKINIKTWEVSWNTAMVLHDSWTKKRVVYTFEKARVVTRVRVTSPRKNEDPTPKANHFSLPLFFGFGRQTQNLRQREPKDKKHRSDDERQKPQWKQHNITCKDTQDPNYIQVRIPVPRNLLL